MAAAKPAALTVDQALARILDGVAPTASETVPIGRAHGRTLAANLAARLTQPPFDASAMDGYAVLARDVATLPARLDVIGEAAAGHPFVGTMARGQAVRIFTGAPVPAGADAVVIQENTRREGSAVVIHDGQPDRDHVRKRGSDFSTGQELLATGRVLGPRELSLAAAMGHGAVPVRRRPRVCILATGDELVAPGEMPGPSQIIASNHLGVAALAERSGADTELIGIARDTRESLEAHVAKADGADILVTIGGASVGDHDLVAPTLGARGMQLAFWKIAMRPGKPLMFGTLGASRVLGLPGNPVSALICARIFLVPLVRALLGRPPQRDDVKTMRTAAPLAANGPRQHYMRAVLGEGPDGTPHVTPLPSQDSSLLSPLAAADVLIVRPANAEPVPAGGDVQVISLDL
ncbi:MAG: molybdopterin molybdenumtransferase MoeA [Hyphomicrobiales bacterium]|nr:MAG: molybdopterin molybdenumtransferase MoeA [Hyphomicrobiales bacterium]